MNDEFERWYGREYPRLVNTIALATGDRTVATEAASEACLRALERWTRVQAMAHPGGWIYRVAMNDARRRLKRQSRERATWANQLPGALTVPPPIEPDQALWSAVARLPERTREAVVLRYVADLSESEIAEVLGIRRGTVAVMLSRARRRLSAELDPEPTTRTGEYEHVTH